MFGDIRTIDGNTVYFKDGKQQDFDAIILATGYLNKLERILNVDSSRIQDAGMAINEQHDFVKDGLYFCGFYVSPMGLLHEIGIEALKIAKDISATKRTPVR